MARHVPIVAILMIVQGALELVLGLLFVAIGPFMMAMLSKMPAPSGGDLPPAFISVIYIAMGIPLIALAVLRIVAAIRNLKYRSRVLGIVALGSGAVTVLGCYCLPTALALMVYGLIVYLNEESVRAFAWAEEGLSPAEIRSRLDQPKDTAADWQRGHFQ